MDSSSPSSIGENSPLNGQSDEDREQALVIGTSLMVLDTSTASSEPGGTENGEPDQRQQQDGLSCDEYYMALAFLCAQRSKDPVTQVGACIVEGNKDNQDKQDNLDQQDKQILSTGYNGMPTGCPDHRMPWGKQSENLLNKKHLYVCHAEMNAILNKNAADVRGAEIHVTLFPCNECAKLIIQSGITSVVYYSDKHAKKDSTQASKLMFDSTEVKYRKYSGKIKHLTLNFYQNYERLNSYSSTRIDSSSLTSRSSPPFDPENPRPYEACINWDEYFMAVAFLAARRGTRSPEQPQAGACLVNSDLRIVGIGFDTRIAMKTSTDECVHAVVNAILNKNCSDVHECSLYVTSFPCNECAKVIVQAGITKVTYFSGNNDDEKTTASKMIFDLADVKYVKYSSFRTLKKEIALDFSSVDGE